MEIKIGQEWRFKGSDKVVTIKRIGSENIYFSDDTQMQIQTLLTYYEPVDTTFNPQPHYDNSKGSLYKVAEDRGWNSYQFDIIKRIDRATKKGKFAEDLQKTKDLIDLWLLESKNNDSN